MNIWGAGLAGLLTANMLRKWQPKIIEKHNELPNNHDALLRFRTDKVGTACSIPFKKVSVDKAIMYENTIITQPNLLYSNMYSDKVIGSVLSRSINSLESVERYIAPLNLISQMSKDCSITYDYQITEEDIIESRRSGVPTISTLPMPLMMKLIGYQLMPNFTYQRIYTQKADIDEPEVNINQTIYYPDPRVNHYRISIVGNVVIAEFTEQPANNSGELLMDALYNDFGFRARRLSNLSTTSQKYGKIRPIDDKIRQDFIYSLTEEYNIYSVGRFATWRQLLLDDVVQDIQLVEKFINNTDYTRWMHKSGS